MGIPRNGGDPKTLVILPVLPRKIIINASIVYIYIYMCACVLLKINGQSGIYPIYITQTIRPDAFESSTDGPRAVNRYLEQLL